MDIPSTYRRVIEYVLKVGTHSVSSMRRKLDVRVVVLLNGIGLFMLVRDMQVMCFDTTSSGSIIVWPHIVVEYVEMVTVKESMMHSRSA